MGVFGGGHDAAGLRVKFSVGTVQALFLWRRKVLLVYASDLEIVWSVYSSKVQVCHSLK